MITLILMVLLTLKEHEAGIADFFGFPGYGRRDDPDRLIHHAFLPQEDESDSESDASTVTSPGDNSSENSTDSGSDGDKEADHDPYSCIFHSTGDLWEMAGGGSNSGSDSGSGSDPGSESGSGYDFYNDSDSDFDFDIGSDIDIGSDMDIDSDGDLGSNVDIGNDNGSDTSDGNDENLIYPLAEGHNDNDDTLSDGSSVTNDFYIIEQATYDDSTTYSSQDDITDPFSDVYLRTGDAEQ